MSENFGLGGTEVKLDAGEAIQEIPQNKTLLVEKLTHDTPIKPEIVKGLNTVNEVFQHYQPKVEVEFKTLEGTTHKESLGFSNLGDFGIKGITAQSEFLKGLTAEKEQHNKIIKQLKTNKILKAALSDPDAKMALSAVINGLIKELNDLDK